MAALTDRVHDAEQSYERVRRGESPYDAGNLRLELECVREAVDEYEGLYRSRLKDFLGTPANRQTDPVAERLLRQTLAELGDKAPRPLRQLLTRLTTVALEDALRPLLAAVPALARDIGKPVPAIHLTAEGARISRAHEPVLRDVFGHLLRNAVDHGLEPASERSAHGKPEVGTIRLEVTLNGTTLIVHLQDDGRGMALEKLQQTAAEARIPVSGDDDTAIAELIFRSGLSTAASVTTVSGRGVGMDAVRQAVQEIGGAITVEFTGERNASGHRPFRFLIQIPQAAE